MRLSHQIKAITLFLFCYLTQSAAFIDLQSNKVVTLEKNQKVQVIHVKQDKTIVYVYPGYYMIDSHKLNCR